jgi:putative flippase GtrA
VRSSKIAYLLVAGTCALLHNAILIGFDAIGIDYVTASIVSFVVVVLVGFTLHTQFTFRGPVVEHGLLRYAWAMAANLPLSIVALFIFHTLLSLPMFIAAPLSVVALFVVNFVLARWAIVGHPDRARVGEPS